jgi:hypothetical protein
VDLVESSIMIFYVFLSFVLYLSLWSWIMNLLLFYRKRENVKLALVSGSIPHLSHLWGLMRHGGVYYRYLRYVILLYQRNSGIVMCILS